MDFFYVTKVENANYDEDIDGVIGFARPGKSMALNPAATPTDKKFFLDEYERWRFGVSFSTMIYSNPESDSDADRVSYVDIGGIDETFAGSRKVWQGDVLDDFFWSMGMQAIRFGDDDNQAVTFDNTAEGVFTEQGLYTIWDISSPDIYISMLWFESFA